MPLAPPIQHAIGAAMRSDACAATPASSSSSSISLALGAGMPASAAKACRNSLAVIAQRSRRVSARHRMPARFTCRRNLYDPAAFILHGHRQEAG